MGVAANWPPNFAATEASFGSNFAEGPIQTYAGLPPAGMASGGDGLVASMSKQVPFCPSSSHTIPSLEEHVLFLHTQSVPHQENEMLTDLQMA